MRLIPPGAKHNWAFECTALSGGLNTNLDCDDRFPNNEPNIVVDASNPKHMISSSNDYGSCCDQYYTSFDAGKSWSTGNMSTEDDTRTGSDPVTAIDVKHHVALHSSLNYTFKEDGEACDGDVVVSPSKDGGLSWDKPKVVGFGQGCDLDAVQVFNDKEWIATDNNPHSPYYGRTYVTWTAFLSNFGEYVESPIMETHSDDGGKHWSKPQEIFRIESRPLHFPDGREARAVRRVPGIGHHDRPRRDRLRRVHEQPERVPLRIAGRVRRPVSRSSSRRTAVTTGRSRTSSRAWRTARGTTRSTSTADKR